MNLKEFVDECKRRKVISSITVYAFASWLLIQVVATTFPYLGFPKIAVTITIILALVFFPIVILFSWFYNVVPDGEETKDTPLEAKELKKHKIAIIGFTAVISVGIIFAISRMLSDKETKEAIDLISEDKIALMAFENYTKDPALDVIGKMAADWISHEIVQNDISAVIDYKTLEDYQKLSISQASIADPFSLGKLIGGNLVIISGSYYLKDGKLIFQCRIMDAQDRKKDFGFENTEVNVGEELKGIELLTQTLIEYLSLKGSNNELVDSEIPNFTAYDYFLQAKETWSQDYDHTLSLLNKVLAINPDFRQASYLLARLYYNTKNYEQADSVINAVENQFRSLKKNENTSRSDKNNIAFLRALLNGENGAAYESHTNLNKYNPSNFAINTESMVTALEFVNKPDDVLTYYENINDQELNDFNCYYCTLRDEFRALADLMQDDYKSAVEGVRDHITLTNRRKSAEILVKAYAAENSVELIDELLENAEKKYKLDKDWRYLIFVAANEFKLRGNDEMALKYGQQAIEAYEEGKVLKKMLGRINLIIGDDARAKYYFESFLEGKPSDTYSMAKLAHIYYREGNVSKGEALIAEMDNFKEPYQYGMIDYHKAQAYANMGQESLAIEHLTKSVRQGKRFKLFDFQNDPDLMPLFDSKEFDEVLNYWH